MCAALPQQIAAREHLQLSLLPLTVRYSSHLVTMAVDAVANPGEGVNLEQIKKEMESLTSADIGQSKVFRRPQGLISPFGVADGALKDP